MPDPLQEALLQRELAEHDDPTIRRALQIVGQRLNPVRVVDVPEMIRLYRDVGMPNRTPEANQQLYAVGAFRRHSSNNVDPHIYVNRDGPHYKNAAKGNNALADAILAGSLVHEQIHNTEKGAMGEYAARRKEADFIQSKLESLPKVFRRRAEDRIRELNREAKAYDDVVQRQAKERRKQK